MGHQASPRLATRVAQMQESASIAMADVARRRCAAGRNVINLAIGEPDFPTPQHIQYAAIQALVAGQTRYTNVDGTSELKRAVIEKLERENSLEYSDEQIIVSAGVKQALCNLLLALIEPGDEVIVPAPYWVSYPEMVRLAGGVPVFAPCSFDQSYKLSPATLEQSLTERTRLLLINSPNNPTGAVYSRDELEALAAVLRHRPRVLIASDDIYEHIRWSRERFHNIANAAVDLRDRIVILNGVSKAYAMTGWRIGYAAGPAWLVDAMRKIQSQTTSNPNSIAQAAAAAALRSGTDCVQPMVREFRRRHDWCADALNRIDGVRCRRADGAFYLFADVSDLMARRGTASDGELTLRLLEEAGIATVAGSAYGMPNHLRFAFAARMEELELAFGALQEFAA